MAIVSLTLAATLASSCASRCRCDNECPAVGENKTEHVQPAGGPLFTSLFDSIKKWPGIQQHEFREFIADAENAQLPVSSALYETGDKSGYLYITHVGQHVAITLVDKGYNVRDVKTFPSKLGFSTCWKQGLILTLHRHPGTGMFVDTKVFVQTTPKGIDLQYTVE